MQYKSLFLFLGGGVWGGVCVEVSLKTAFCCQKIVAVFLEKLTTVGWWWCKSLSMDNLLVSKTREREKEKSSRLT